MLCRDGVIKRSVAGDGPGKESTAATVRYESAPLQERVCVGEKGWRTRNDFARRIRLDGKGVVADALSPFLFSAPLSLSFTLCVRLSGFHVNSAVMLMEKERARAVERGGGEKRDREEKTCMPKIRLACLYQALHALY